MPNAIDTVLDYVVDAVQTAWPTAVVTKEDPKMVNPAPIVWVRYMITNLEPETVSSDALTLAVTIHGRFAAMNSAARTAMWVSLRTALLADKNCGGVAYRPEATEFTGYDDENMLDPVTEVGIVFQCMISMAR